MDPSPRRKFLKIGSVSLALLASLPKAFLNSSAMSASANPSNDFSRSCLDYGRSFIINTGQYNAVRLWIESRTTIIDTRTGKESIYLQCASCKSEDTFGKEGLFYPDNYDFLPIFGDDQVLVFRRHVDIRDSYRIVRPTTEMWGGNPNIHLVYPDATTELNTWEEIRDYTAAGIPIVTQTEIVNDMTGLKAIIECPCKTMNISHVKKMYQVDNGPVALPDLTKRYDSQIESFRLAFIAFNTPDFADFVIEAPTSVKVDGKEVVKVNHYSKLESYESTNKVIALGRI